MAQWDNPVNEDLSTCQGHATVSGLLQKGQKYHIISYYSIYNNYITIILYYNYAIIICYRIYNNYIIIHNIIHIIYNAYNQCLQCLGSCVSNSETVCLLGCFLNGEVKWCQEVFWP